MIKVNLLNSVTERQGGAVVAVDRKLSSPMSRLLVMSIATALLLATVIGIDVISSQMSKSKAEADLVEEKRIEQELAAVLKEQKELEQKNSKHRQAHRNDQKIARYTSRTECRFGSDA